MATLSFSITVPDAKQAEIIEYFVKQNGYTDTILDADGSPISNPETRTQASRRFILEFIRRSYRSYKVKADQDAAKIAANAATDAVAIT